MAEVTYQAPEKPQGTVTIVLTEREALDFAQYKLPVNKLASSSEFIRYRNVRNDVHKKIRAALNV